LMMAIISFIAASSSTIQARFPHPQDQTLGAHFQEACHTEP
jgi:hypothetical protein